MAPDWQTLKRWWLDGHERSWTSVSFLIDRRGVIRHAHLGGKLAPDTDDFCVMRAKIEAGVDSARRLDLAPGVFIGLKACSASSVVRGDLTRPRSSTKRSQLD